MNFYAVIREDYASERDRLTGQRPTGVGIVCETLPSLAAAKEIAAIGNRDFGQDVGHHFFSIHPSFGLSERLRLRGWEK